MFRKVLVANRGEIAVRVMRACRELDVRTVAIYSDADTDSGHVRYADEAYNVGPRRPAESYLDMEAILDVAERADVDAIHPGYGFLAENAEFAERVEQSPFVWIGPSSDAMRQLGGKTGARTVMESASVPIVPGTTDPVSGVDEIVEFGEAHGYPIAIKADAGGGGRGMVVVDGPDAVEDALERAMREGDAYFDDNTVYLEKFLPDPKHVEVQIIADHHGNVRHLGERDCSLQRRHQKVIEEAPSPTLTDSLREDIGEAARRGIAAADYTNAGTVEFLVWEDDFYFMEVNTRIQVEHCATEMVTGLDIVKWQIRVAAGEEIDFDQSDVSLDGHAIEYRINAENPAEDFAPDTGELTTYDPPGGIGVRLDDAIREGDEIVGDYDSMIAKVIVHASDRDECLRRSERALREFEIEGIHTVIPFHRLMLTDERFTAGTHTTAYLDEELDPDRIEAAVDRWGPTTVSDGSTADALEHEYTVEVDGKRFSVALTDHGNPVEPATETDPESFPTTVTEPSETHAGTSGETLTAEMQGTVLSVAVEEGDTVEPGDVVCVIEAMKMENDVVASAKGTVTGMNVASGDTVETGDILCIIE